MATLWSWGYNGYGELGLGDTASRSSPVQVGSLADWVSVGAGGNHLTVVKTDGTLWSCGYNNYGQLGLGDIADRSNLVQVGSLTDWSSIKAGYDHTVAVKTDGTLWSWGHNNYGQLGLGDTADRSSPVQVGTLTDWLSIGVGYSYSLAIKTDGTLWSWGYNGNGELGLGDNSNRSSPVQVGSLTDWSSIKAGYDHTLAIKTDGTLWSWGYNGYGELGLGDTNFRFSPCQIGSLTNWSFVSAGGHCSFAIKSDGTLWSWGYNTYGELGLGDTAHRSSPCQVGSLTNWSSLGTGSDHSVAVRTDGTLWSWGHNPYGQLGVGNTSDYHDLVQIGSRADWSSISCGHKFSLGFITVAPSIVSGTLALDNSYCKIIFSKLVYSDALASSTITKDDFLLNFVQNGGDATAASITGLYVDSGLTSPLASGTGYDTVYAKLNITGIPTGDETIEIKPVSGSAIYDASGNVMPDTKTTGALALHDVPASIINGVISNDNAYVEIDFSEDVWADSGKTTELSSSSFLVDFQQNGGGISAASINALYQDAALSIPLASGVGYSTVYAQLLVTSGFPTGAETIEIKPKDGSSIYDSSSVAMDAAETTGLLYFHSVGSAVSLNWSTLDPVISSLRSIISLFLVSLFGHGLHVFFTDKALFQEVENDLHTRISSLPTSNQALGIELLNFFQRYYGK